jgi:hypothetical protein
MGGSGAGERLSQGWSRHELHVAFLNSSLRAFAARPEEMDARLRARPGRGEWLALTVSLGILAIFLWLDGKAGYLPFDYGIYVKTAEGNLIQYYYADWLLPLFWLWSRLPSLWGYASWAVLNLLCICFAARVFGGRSSLALLTFQSFYLLFLGQITGLVIGALALGWWGLAHRRWYLAGFGFWLAGTKFQIGLPFGLLLLLTAQITWRDRFRVLILPAVLSLASLAIFPGWPGHLLERMRAYPPWDWGSIGLWAWIGPVALLFFLPPLLLPMSRPERFLALAAAIPLALPYFQQADLPVLYVLPVGWLPVMLGNLGFLFFRYRFEALRLLWVVPLIAYLAAVLPAAVRLVSRGRGKKHQAPGSGA